MVDRIQKSLRKLSQKERVQLGDIIQRIRNNQMKDLDIKKLHGREDIFRVRKGAIRVIFQRGSSGETQIIAVERRSDVTYNDF